MNQKNKQAIATFKAAYLLGNRKIENISSRDMSFFSYHRLENMVISCIPDEKRTRWETNQIRESTEKSKVFQKVAFDIASVFGQHDINFVFLKGFALAVSKYQEPWHRKYKDIDILIERKDVEKAVSLLTSIGFRYGFVRSDGTIYTPQKVELLRQSMYTHEVYNMFQIVDGCVCNVDVNFEFSWREFSREEVFSVSSALTSRTYVDVDNQKVPILSSTVMFLHLIMHLYNECQYFALNTYYVGRDPHELLVFRLVDLLLIREDEIDVEIIEKELQKSKWRDAIAHGLFLCEYVFNEEFFPRIQRLIDWQKVSAYELCSSYCDRSGQRALWPLSLDERIYDIEKKSNLILKHF